MAERLTAAQLEIIRTGSVTDVDGGADIRRLCAEVESLTQQVTALTTENAALRQERDDCQKEVEHWVTRFNELDMRPGDALRMLDAEIARDEQLLERKRAVRDQMAALYGGEAASSLVTKGSLRARTGQGRKYSLAAGSLGHRIVQFLGEVKAPTKVDDVVEAAKARKSDVLSELKLLVRHKHVAAISGGRWRRYALPMFAKEAA